MSKIYNDNQLNRVMDPSKRVYNSKYIFVMNKKNQPIKKGYIRDRINAMIPILKDDE